MKIQCPACHAVLKISLDDFMGRCIVCTACGQLFLWRSDSDHPSTSTVKGKKKYDMVIKQALMS